MNNTIATKDAHMTPDGYTDAEEIRRIAIDRAANRKALAERDLADRRFDRECQIADDVIRGCR